MSDDRPDRKQSGFKEQTRVEAARTALRDRIDPIDRTERVGLERADGRVLAEPITAERNGPHYRRAAMDGYAVRASDTFGASDRSPAVVSLGDRADPVAPGRAVRVHTGSELPEGADAVVMIEDAETVGGEIEVFDAAAEGENVAPVGEDVEAGQSLYDPGHRLRPSDLGLLRSTGVERVTVRERPRVAVIPTGEELVRTDPDPGEVVETNGLTVSRLVDRWGADASYREVVTDDVDALREAIERDLDHDVVVTTGGSSVGERDLLPEVVDDLGEVFVHGVALKPGHPVALGVVGGTPVLMLPGYPVACIVNAVQFLRPALAWLQGTSLDPTSTVEATLERKLPSEPGVRTFARVQVRGRDRGEGTQARGREGDSTGGDDPLTAVPTRTSGSGVLSSVALADGWVVVPEESEGYPEGERVTVQYWEVQL